MMTIDICTASHKYTVKMCKVGSQNLYKFIHSSDSPTMKIALFLFTVFYFIPLCQSSGFIRFDLTSDRDCLLHLEHSSEYSETVRLLAYETRTLEVYTHGNHNTITMSFQLLHHFSGNPLSETSNQLFQLSNNGQWESRVIDNDKIILSIRSTFYCENGYYGPICERRSRIIPTTTSIITTSTSSYFSQSLELDFQISDAIIIYTALAFFVLLLIIFCILCCYGPQKKSKYLEECLPVEGPKEVFRIDEFFGFLDETIATPYTQNMDAPRLLSSTTIQSRV